MRPVGTAAALTLVDGRPVCAACGRAVEPTGPGTWGHATRPRSRAWRRWLAPIDLDVAIRLPTYEAFGDRYPWAIHPSFGGSVVTSSEAWQEARWRLARYRAALRIVRRWRLLRAGENPYLELVAILGAPADAAPGREVDALIEATGRQGRWAITPGVGQVLGLRERRREMAALFSWAIPSGPALEMLGRYGPLVDGGAGTGYWAALLAAAGADVVAFDLAPPSGAVANPYHPGRRTAWHGVQPLSTIDAVRRNPDRTLLMVWPPHGDDESGYRAVRAYRGHVLLLVGEGADGATGSVRLHRELELNWRPIATVAIPRWPSLSDRLVVFGRAAERRPLATRDRCPGCGRFVPTGSLDRCMRCVVRHPPALAISVDGSRVEYSVEQVEAMPVGLRLALEASVNRIR